MTPNNVDIVAKFITPLNFFFRYCPDCCKNQCATKTLTVWRFPDFLILYLKRYGNLLFKYFIRSTVNTPEIAIFSSNIEFFYYRFIFMGNDGTYADGSFNATPGGTAIKLNKDVEFKVIYNAKSLSSNISFIRTYCILQG